MNKRIIFDLIILGAVLYLPWWVVLVLGLFGTFYWAPFYEIILIGVLVDILYGSQSLPLGGTLGLIIALMVYIIGSYAKKAVR